jgi:hypothetical protein
MAERFKLDLLSIAAEMRAANDTADGWTGLALVCIGDLSRQLHAAGAPGAPFEEQSRTLLASHRALAEAGEEMPSALGVTSDLYEYFGDDNDASAWKACEDAAGAVLDLIRPLFARLTQERDDARLALSCSSYDAHTLRQRAERAERELHELHGMILPEQNEGESDVDTLRRLSTETESIRARIADLEAQLVARRVEPGADVVERLRRVEADACQRAAGELPASLIGFSRDKEIGRAGIRTLLSALAETGEEACPLPESDGLESAFVAWAARVPYEHGQDAQHAAGRRGVAVYARASALSVIGALRAENASLKSAILMMGDVLTEELLPAMREHVDAATLAKGEEVAALIRMARGQA